MTQNLSFLKRELCIEWDKITKYVGLHEGVDGGYFVAYIIAKKILDVRYWWPILFKDTHDFYKSCHNYQKVGGLKTKNLDRLVTTFPKEPFMKWGLDFICPITPT